MEAAGDAEDKSVFLERSGCEIVDQLCVLIGQIFWKSSGSQ